jgi:DNA-binding SARP family transcriptional activator/class 3 adenylate cyclase
MTGGVLIVDDTPANIRLLEAILSTHAHAVRSAASGPEALDIITGDTPPDLVLLDIQMPGMNGYEVCRRIRENAATALLPVIMITASGNEEKVAALEAGADDFIPRPFDQSELLARVRSLLRIKSFHETIADQAAELAAWNRVLEDQIAEQVDEMQRLQRLRRFLSAHVADSVLMSGDEGLLEPHRGEVAVIFCDLRGFTSFAASSEPEEVLAALQGYHRLVGEIVSRHAATVGYFAGDGVMMFFNDPFPCPQPALRAVTAAVELRDAMEAFGTQWEQRGHRLGVGIGITFGFATLGLIGFEGRHDYSAIGPIVNLASRLCDEAASAEILIGQRTYAAVKDAVEASARGELTLRGIESPQPTWRVHAVTSALEPAVPPTATPVDDRQFTSPGTAASSQPVLPASPDDGLSFYLLGPLEVSLGGVELPLRASKVRQLLSLLLLHRDQVMSVDRLADALWEGSPPESATAALRVHISRLRKLLSTVGQEGRLLTRPTGYQLDVDDESIDVVRFESLAAKGRAALEAGQPEAAAETLRYALKLWRGTAFADIASSPFVTAEAARLEESRLECIEDCIDAELACGRQRRVLGELEGLVTAHPLRERLWAQRMTALYRSGRQPEALEAYQTLRRHLADELGLDPSPELTDLHAAILNRSADLETAGAPASST